MSNLPYPRPLTVNGHSFHAHWVTGKVVEAKKHSTTHVIETTRKDNTKSVSSTTTIHDDIFLVDANGKEHSFQLTGFDVACRADHELSVVWLILNGKETGKYAQVVNWTTDKFFYNHAGINKVFPTNYKIVIVSWVIVGVLIVWGLLSMNVKASAFQVYATMWSIPAALVITFFSAISRVFRRKNNVKKMIVALGGMWR